MDEPMDMEVAKQTIEAAKDAVMHIVALGKLAMADGLFHSKERRVMKAVAARLAHELGLDTFEEVHALIGGGTIRVDDSLAWRDSVRADPVKAKRVLKDMLVLAYADGNCSLDEQYTICAVADEYGIGQAELKEISEAVRSLKRAEDELNSIVEK